MPHILIVDDEPELCALLTRIVISLDYQASSVTSGEAALKALESQQIDLVLLDHYMVGMSGLDTAKVLHEKGVPFLFCTSSVEDEVLRHAMAQGALNYIVKPFTAAKVIFAVGSSLGRIEERQQNNLVQLATGILMARNSSDRDEARQSIENDANEQGITVIEIAQQIVEQQEGSPLG